MVRKLKLRIKTKDKDLAIPGLPIWSSLALLKVFLKKTLDLDEEVLNGFSLQELLDFLEDNKKELKLELRQLDSFRLLEIQAEDGEIFIIELV